MGGNSYNDQGVSVTTDDLGNVYTTGSFSNTVDFDPGVGTLNLISAGQEDIFIQKLNANGNLLWAKSMGGVGADYSRSVATDALGNVYTTGWFDTIVDFDPGVGILNLTSAGQEDIFIQKLDANGNLLWVKSMGGTSNDYGTAITTDALGNIYTTGYFDTIVDFDPGVGILNLTSAGASDIFIQKLDANGNLIWAKSTGGSSYEQAVSITTDALGNVYTTGSFFDTVDFDPDTITLNLISAGATDIFIQKLNANGNLLWAKSMGGSLYDAGTSTTDSLGNVYTTGYFRDTVDFDPGVGTLNLISAGASDIFIQKLSQCYTSYNTDTQTACDNYIWIDGNTYTSSNSTATDTLANAAGCDSVVTLNLTINTVDNGINNNSPTLTAAAAGATYQWLDCDNNFTPITGEVNQSYTATASGNYAVEVTKNNCTDTSDCESVTVVGLQENKVSNIHIHPNPTNDQITINIKGYHGPVEVEVYDLSGRLLLTTKFTTLSIKNYAKGIYVFKVSYGDRVEEIKVVKD